MDYAGTIFIIFLTAVVFTFSGWMLCAYFLVKNKRMIMLRDDQVVVMKPDPGMTLVALPPDVLRKVVVGKYNYDTGEARSIVEKYAASQNKNNVETTLSK
jgi:hypothetical protein